MVLGNFKCIASSLPLLLPIMGLGRVVCYNQETLRMKKSWRMNSLCTSLQWSVFGVRALFKDRLSDLETFFCMSVCMSVLVASSSSTSSSFLFIPINTGGFGRENCAGGTE